MSISLSADKSYIAVCCRKLEQMLATFLVHKQQYLGATVKAGTQECGTVCGTEVMCIHTRNYTEMMQEI